MGAGWRITVSPEVLQQATAWRSTVGTLGSALIQVSADTLLPFLREATPIGHAFDRTGAPRLGGHLRASLFWQQGLTLATLMGAPYGRYVIAGTAPHLIRPRRARALSFFWPRVGAPVVFGAVHHPGTAPQDFRQIGVQAAIDTEALPQAWQRVLLDWLNGEIA
jgi:hypothetical protein